jgi:hypothetical protein
VIFLKISEEKKKRNQKTNLKNKFTSSFFRRENTIKNKSVKSNFIFSSVFSEQLVEE